MKSWVVLGSARALGALARRSGMGGGTALPGLLVEKAAPAIIPALARQLSEGVVLVTGTNGKTTTARLIAAILGAAGYQVLHNRAGSNLIRGIAATLVQAAQASGGGRIGLFEVDEATLPEAVQRLRPRLVAILNLFRDQLDRYGEVDTVARRWREALARLPTGAVVVLNVDDPVVASLAFDELRQRDARLTARFFGLEDRALGLSQREHAADFIECEKCATPYDYCVTYYGHVGIYRCPSCGWERPAPVVRGVAAEVRGLEGSTVTVSSGDEEVAIESWLPGLYNVYNVLAAAAAATALGLSLADVAKGMAGFRPVFGRGEGFSAQGKPMVLLLTKNPVGTNQVIRALLAKPGEKPLLIALNDSLADGEDISWIWDVDFEALRGSVRWVVASGHRAEDMALRLKYAGLFPEPSGGGDAISHGRLPFRRRPMVLPDLEAALRTALYHLPAGETLYLLATYSAMLELRRVLTRMGVLRPFWEEQ